MGTDIKLKDLFGQTQTEQDISTVSVPKAAGTGREYYVKRPVIYYTPVKNPPYAPQETDNSVFYINWGDGTFGGDMDMGNSGGTVVGAVEGKTTKPVVYIKVSKYLQGVTADNTGSVVLIYLYETLAGATLLEIKGISGTADFTAQPGWGQLIQGADGKTYTYTQLADLGDIAIGIEQPNNIFNQRLFYSFLTEKTNSSVAYTATKNGAYTIVPPAESSGVSNVSLTVDVPMATGASVDFSINIGDALNTIYFNTIHDTTKLDTCLETANYPYSAELSGITMPWNNALVCTLGTSSLYVHIGNLSSMQPGTYIIYVMQSETPTVLYSTKALDASAVIPGMVISKGWNAKSFSIGAEVTVSDILNDLLLIKDNYFAKSPQTYG